MNWQINCFYFIEVQVHLLGSSFDSTVLVSLTHSYESVPELNVGQIFRSYLFWQLFLNFLTFPNNHTGQGAKTAPMLSIRHNFDLPSGVNWISLPSVVASHRVHMSSAAESVKNASIVSDSGAHDGNRLWIGNIDPKITEWVNPNVTSPFNRLKVVRIEKNKHMDFTTKVHISKIRHPNE